MNNMVVLNIIPFYGTKSNYMYKSKLRRQVFFANVSITLNSEIDIKLERDQFTFNLHVY